MKNYTLHYDEEHGEIVEIGITIFHYLQDYVRFVRIMLFNTEF